MSMTAVATDHTDGLRLVFWIETGIGEGLSDPVYLDLPEKILSGAALDRVVDDFALAFMNAYSDAVGK